MTLRSMVWCRRPRAVSASAEHSASQRPVPTSHSTSDKEGVDRVAEPFQVRVRQGRQDGVSVQAGVDLLGLGCEGAGVVGDQCNVLALRLVECKGGTGPSRG